MLWSEHVLLDMIMFCAVCSIPASPPSSFSSAALQSLSLHIMHNGNRHLFIHPDPKGSFVAPVSVSTCCCSLCYANIQRQHVGNVLTPAKGGFVRHSLTLLLTPTCALLAGTMANLAFLLHTLPKDRPPLLLLFHHTHCFILPFGFSISPWNPFFKGSVS